jgi:ubiquinone/menaquinone biosynthesis C-methylase UbiE
MGVSARWDERYREGTTPWDSGLPSAELRRVVGEQLIAPCRVLEPGCGTGTNAIWLAQQGFSVTAVDCSELALERAREKADDAGVSVDWICADVTQLSTPDEPFPFVFDRGCFHCIRRDLPTDLQATLRNVTATGTRYLVLTGNANERREHGPPSLTENELRTELAELFDIEFLREFHFEDPGGVQGPLGWSCLAVRR